MAKKNAVASKTSEKPPSGKPSGKSDDEPPKTDVKRDSSSFFLSTKFLSQCCSIGMVLLAFASSYAFQYYQETYVIPLEKEKSFPFLKPDIFDTDRTNLRRVNDPNAILRFTNVKNPSSGDILLELISNGMPTPFEKLETYEYDCADTTLGDKFSFSFGRMDFVATYALNKDGIDLKLEGNTRPEDANDVLSTLILSQENGKAIMIPMTDKHVSFYRFPQELDLDESRVNETAENILDFENKWKETFESVFHLSKQNMPHPYQVLGQKGLAYAFSCINQQSEVQVVGAYDTNFTLPRKFYYVESRNIPLRSLEEQVFPLIAMSKFDSTEVLKVLYSWINTVNELGHMGVWWADEGLHLEKVQTPLLFQLVKQLFGNKRFDNSFKELHKNLDMIAELTWKNSIGQNGLKDVKWLGHSRGLFQLEPATPQGSSSFELLCMLEDMCRVMNEVFERSELRHITKWADRVKEVAEARRFYWDNEGQRYCDLEKGTFKNTTSAYSPLILSLFTPDSTELGLLIAQVMSDSNSFTPLGLQISEEQGAPVSTNYLFLRSLRFYSDMSGPSQEDSHLLYSRLKNNLIAGIARSNRLEKSFYGSFDRNMRPLGFKGHLDGTLVLSIMSE